MPIKWFGDKEEYLKSEIKIITVALNPSDLEFRNNNDEVCTTKLRFPDFDSSNNDTYELALNNYFRKNPLGWFKQGFEPILEGRNECELL